jgi:hypothetical protein
MSEHSNSANSFEKQMDATLRLFAQAQTPAGLEQRIHARLHQQSAHAQRSIAARWGSFLFGQRIIFASAAASLGCVLIVMSSVQHSHQRVLPASGVHLPAPGSGIGAASSTHIAPEPIMAPEHARSRSERKATGGRATVSRNTHKPKGVAVPESTEPEKP